MYNEKGITNMDRYLAKSFSGFYRESFDTEEKAVEYARKLANSSNLPASVTDTETDQEMTVFTTN